MIAKFHSAPGHSMETTLTINIPPPERIRAAKGERLREKQKEKDKIQTEIVQGLPGRIKDREKDDETLMREKEEERARRDDREREREKLERERRALAERGTSYKDKFQKMREKYDRVTSTHETNVQELDILNEKVKKLQAEHDLLLDAVFLADTPLYDRHFPSGPGFGPPPIAHPGPPQHPPHPTSMSSSSHSYHKPAHGHGTYAQHPGELQIGGPLQPMSRFLDNPAASSSGPSPKPVHNYYHPQSHGQNVELQEHSKPQPYYGYPSRDAMHPDPIHPPAHNRHSQHSTYRHYVPPSDHHGMPPPPPPIPGSDSERERQRERDWERDRMRREWEWEREGRHPPYKEYGGLPPTPPLVPAVGLPPPSNGYNSMTQNGHGYVHGHEYGHSGHSLPPPTSVTRTHTRHGSRTSRSNPSRSASRRRNEGMKMEIDVDAEMRLPPADVERSLGGPIHLDPDQEVSRKRERGSHSSRSAEHDHGRRESRSSRRSSESRKPAMGHMRTPPMGMLEPVIPEQQGLDIRHGERRQSPHQERGRGGYGYDRSDPAQQFGHATTLRASFEDSSAHPSGFRSWRTEDSDEEDYGQRRVDYDEYEQSRRHDRGGRWGVPGGRIENSGGMDRDIEGAREEEEESDPGEGKVGAREIMVVDEAN